MRGVSQGGGLSGEIIDRDCRGGCRQVDLQLGGRHAQRRRGIGHNVLHLAFPIQHVDRHENDAQAQARQEDVEELHSIGQLKHQAIAGLETARSQCRSHPVCPYVKIPEREGLNGAIRTLVFKADGISPGRERRL